MKAVNISFKPDHLDYLLFLINDQQDKCSSVLKIYPQKQKKIKEELSLLNSISKILNQANGEK